MDGIDFDVGNFDYNAQAMIDFDMDSALAEFGVNDTMLNETAALMDDALGASIDGQNDPLNFGLFSSIGNALGSLWGSGNTAIGAIIGLAGFAYSHVFGDGEATIRFGNGGIMFENNPFMQPGSALTLGQAQIYFGSSTDPVNPNNPNGPTLADHELQHTIQSSLLGPFFLPAYGLGALITFLGGYNPLGPSNPLEEGPYDDPPSPFG